MKRGDVWTVAGGKDYAGKPRPVVIVQDDSFDAAESVTICAFTTDETDAPLFRLPVDPNERNGLRATCHLMVDKITTVSRTRLGTRVRISCLSGLRSTACALSWWHPLTATITQPNSPGTRSRGVPSCRQEGGAH